MNYQYFGLFLDEPTRNKLMQVIIGNPIICNLVFQRGSTIYLDHCTLLHKNQHEEKMANDLQYRIDGNFRLIVNKIGISEKAIAFGVELGDQYLPCANAKPHITICTINKGKLVDSNGIATWIPIPEFSIYCHLKVV